MQIFITWEDKVGFFPVKVGGYNQDRLIEKDIPENFQVIITGFNSKRFISGQRNAKGNSHKQSLIEEVISLAGLNQTSSMDTD